MKIIISMLLLALLGVPALQEGDAAMPVDAFLEKAGVDADDALRDKVEAFLAERFITPRIINMMDEKLARRYVENLSADLPIAYDALLDAPAMPLPEDVDFAEIRQLAVLHPEGATTPSLLVDFERNRVYYDEAWPVPGDVCRAAYAAELTPEAAAGIIGILENAGLADWDADYPGDAAAGVNVLALGFDGGVVRYTAAAVSQAPEAFAGTLLSLLAKGSEYRVQS